MVANGGDEAHEDDAFLAPAPTHAPAKDIGSSFGFISGSGSNEEGTHPTSDSTFSPSSDVGEAHDAGSGVGVGVDAGADGEFGAGPLPVQHEIPVEISEKVANGASVTMADIDDDEIGLRSP